MRRHALRYVLPVREHAASGYQPSRMWGHLVGGEEGDGAGERLLQRAEEDLDLVLVGTVRRVVEARHEHHVAT